MNRPAKILRVVHLGIVAVELGAISSVWAHALAGRRRGRLLKWSVGILAAEGVGLVIGKGHCPLRPLQRYLGDPTPLSEVIFPPKIAKVVFASLGLVAVGGIGMLFAREYNS
jgi:hypothetical protein